VAGAYAAYVGVTWARYGRASAARHPEERDDLLDTFMPRFEVVERHHIRVNAPAAITLAAAKEMDLGRLLVVRALIRAREMLLGAAPDERVLPTGLLAYVRSIGWGVLADVPDHEVVVGAVTKPWESNVVFRALPPEAFAAFDEPGYTKIVWTLRADADTASTSVFRTETRVVATDAEARERFRRYWAFLSPGVTAIRWASLRPLKREAERRARGDTRPN
jgi:hypothetical protein